MAFSVLAYRRAKRKESEKKIKYLDLARELKKLCDMKITTIPFVIGAIGPVTKGLVHGLEEWGPSKIQHYWDRPEYWEESWRLEENYSHWNSSGKQSANSGGKKSKKSK